MIRFFSVGGNQYEIRAYLVDEEWHLGVYDARGNPVGDCIGIVDDETVHDAKVVSALDLLGEIAVALEDNFKKKCHRK